MAKGGSKLLIGCGIGCGVLILVGALLVASGALWVRDLTDDFEGAVELRAALDERHGAPADWTPPADGVIPAERVRRFLAMREASSPARNRIAATMRRFAMSDGKLQSLEHGSWIDRTKEVLRITRSAFDLPSALGEYFTARNRALLDHGIGYGEYAYLYAVGYWSLLEIEPGDGPRVVRLEQESDSEIARVSVRTEKTSVHVQPQVMERVRDELLSMLRNQLAACEAGDSCRPEWRGALTAEIAAMQGDPARLPWPGGPPPPVARSLDPFRDALAASYDEATNPFELARNRQRGSWSIQAE